MFEFQLELSLTVDQASLDLLCVVRNPGTSLIHIGGLNETNFTIRSTVSDWVFAPSWFPTHMRNDKGVHELAPEAQLEFVGNLLKDFEFELAGRYVVVAVYDSVGFNRFCGPRHEPLSYLAKIDPARALSNEVEFEVTSEQLALNKRQIAERRRSFWGEAIASGKDS